MKLPTRIAAMAFTLMAAAAQAAPSAKAADEPAPAASAAPSKQQNKMKTCNAEAKTKALKGDDRKAFMKECLRAK
jgi:invasion protein IalB